MKRTVKTKSPRRKHSVKANVQILDLTRVGSSMKLEIFADDEKIGQIMLGRGSITWKGGKRKTGKTMTWSRFADMMNDEVYGKKRKASMR